MIFTMGYSGMTIYDIKTVAEDLDATIFDVRFYPRPQSRQFNSRHMASVLGDRYLHVRAFGNKNYKGGPIELLDFPAGLEMIIHHRRRNIILLCACKHAPACHRTTIARKLRDYGYIVKEYELPKKDEAIQAAIRL